MAATLKVHGLKELEKVLAALPAKVARRHLVGTVMSGAKVVKDAVQQNTPVRRGFLKSSMRPKFLIGKSTYAEAGVQAFKGFYWLFLEKGTRKTTGQRRVTRGRRKGQRRRGHPGIKARPFVAPAWEVSSGQAFRRMHNELRNRLAQAVRFQ